MNILQVAQNSITAAIRAAGDAIVEAIVAQSVESDPQPGEDYSPSWLFHGGRGFFEKITVEDFVGTDIMSTDHVFVLLQCAHDVEMHDLVRVNERVYHVYGVKPEIVGVTRVLQKLLLRTEQTAGVPWPSSDQVLA